MVKTQTSVNIDSEKRDMARKRGIKLSDLLDQALDMALGLELKESTQLQNKKEDLLNKKEILIKEKDDFLENHENKIFEINFKLNQIEEALGKAIIEDKEDLKQKEYRMLLNMVVKNFGIDKNEVMREIEEFADKYNFTDDEFEELKLKLIQDMNDTLAKKYSHSDSV